MPYTSEANGQCSPTNGAQSVEAFKIFAASPSCTATPGLPSATLTNATTLCCSP